MIVAIGEQCEVAATIGTTNSPLLSNDNVVVLVETFMPIQFFL